MHELIKTITAKVWEKAAQHYLGLGLEAGVDWDSTLRHLRKLDKCDPTKAGILKAIAQGGIWPAERKLQANYIDTELCPRCKEAPETPYHWVWGCKCNKDIDPIIYKTSQAYQARALEEYQEWPSFWLRGLVPAKWTLEKIKAFEQPQWVRSSGIFNQAWPVLEPNNLLFATDASGGKLSSDPRLRRIGWAVVAVVPETLQ
eukprot:5936375-Heterocapsa_arctica.AAC.1